MASSTAHAESSHAPIGLYLKVAVLLTVLTAIEVAVFYIDALSSVLAPLLVVLSIGKFALVAAYFMHLKFDARVYSVAFVAGICLAIAIALGIMAQGGRL